MNACWDIDELHVVSGLGPMSWGLEGSIGARFVGWTSCGLIVKGEFCVIV